MVPKPALGGVSRWRPLGRGGVGLLILTGRDRLCLPSGSAGSIPSRGASTTGQSAQDPDPQINKKTSLGKSLGFPEKYGQKCRFLSQSVRQLGVRTGVSQMRRRCAYVFVPEALPFSHTRSMAACVANGAARVSVAFVGIRWGWAKSTWTWPTSAGRWHSLHIS